MHEPDAHAVRAHPVEERPWVTELDVHRARVGAGLGEVVEQVARGCRSSGGSRGRGPCAAQALHDRRTDREVGHEVAVHHVDVQQIGLRTDPVDFRGELGEVRREDRRCDLPMPPNLLRRVVRRTATAERRYIPSVPAACGSRNAPLPHGRHGAPAAARPRGRAARCGPTRRRRPSRRGSACTPSTPADRPDAPSRPRSGAARAGEPRARRPRRARCATALRAGGASTPKPEHGASTRTRSNDSGRERQVAARRPHRVDRLRPSRVAARCTSSSRPGCTSTATTARRDRPSPRQSRWPSRPARHRSRAPARRAGHRRRPRPPDSPGPAAWRARRRRRHLPGVATAPHDQRVGQERAALHAGAGRDQLGFDLGRGRAAG